MFSSRGTFPQCPDSAWSSLLLRQGLFEQPGPILVARRGHALRKSSLYLFILLLLGGDVVPNPAPQWEYPCDTCGKPVKPNQDGLFCEVCMIWNLLCWDEYR